LIAGSIKLGGYIVTTGSGTVNSYSSPGSMAVRVAGGDAGQSPFPSPATIAATLGNLNTPPEDKRIFEVIQGMQTDEAIDKSKIVAIAEFSSIELTRKLPFSKCLQIGKSKKKDTPAMETLSLLKNMTIVRDKS